MKMFSKKSISILAISLISSITFAQNLDSIKFKNPVDIPDTQRLPPTPVIKEDTTSTKLIGGALIDTINTKPKTRFPKDIDDRKDSLNKRN